jgi:UrcA family protein
MTYGKLPAMGSTIALTLGGLFLIAPPASAKAPILVVAPAEIVTRHITYADLNLASAAGERTLNRRVGSAVSELCAEATGGFDGSLTAKVATIRCGNSAWDQARPQIDRAVGRARDVAATGTSTIPAAAITIVIPE